MPINTYKSLSVNNMYIFFYLENHHHWLECKLRLILSYYFSQNKGFRRNLTLGQNHGGSWTCTIVLTNQNRNSLNPWKLSLKIIFVWIWNYRISQIFARILFDIYLLS